MNSLERQKTIAQVSIWILALFAFSGISAQNTNPVLAIFPLETRLIQNVAYAGDT